jgi:hypothetical protein
LFQPIFSDRFTMLLRIAQLLNPTESPQVQNLILQVDWAGARIWPPSAAGAAQPWNTSPLFSLLFRPALQLLQAQYLYLYPAH